MLVFTGCCKAARTRVVCPISVHAEHRYKPYAQSRPQGAVTRRVGAQWWFDIGAEPSMTPSTATVITKVLSKYTHISMGIRVGKSRTPT